jgi:Rad3-related DNA helicase
VSILDHFPPGLTPRPAQRDLLLEIERLWAEFDVCVVVAPTAVGKSEIGLCIARWQASRGATANILQPDNVLFEQFHGRYPDVRVLKRRDSYPDVNRFRAARLAAKYAKVRLTNYHVCFANKLAAEVHIVDEAHRLTDLLEDGREIKFWRHEYDFPLGLRLLSDVVAWAQRLAKSLDPDSRQGKRLARLIAELVAVRGDSSLEYTRDMYRGRAVDVLIVKPGLQRKAPDWLWPRGTVRKMVFMSATISREDIRELGLAGRRVTYLECESPIPAANRPLLFRPRLNMARDYQQHSVPLFAKMLAAELERRPEKGMVHVPYSMAEWLRSLLDSPRLIFHDKFDKQEALDRFKASPPEDGKVLVASGMYEGIDLPYDAARWQIIGKVPFLSLGDEQVRRRMEAYPDWYDWSALRNIIQACGRIVRSPDDYGETVVWDVSLKPLLARDARRAQPLIPRFFKDAIRELTR